MSATQHLGLYSFRFIPACMCTIKNQRRSVQTIPGACSDTKLHVSTPIMYITSQTLPQLCQPSYTSPWDISFRTLLTDNICWCLGAVDTSLSCIYATEMKSTVSISIVSPSLARTLVQASSSTLELPCDEYDATVMSCVRSFSILFPHCIGFDCRGWAMYIVEKTCIDTSWRGLIQCHII